MIAIRWESRLIRVVFSAISNGDFHVAVYAVDVAGTSAHGRLPLHESCPGLSRAIFFISVIMAALLLMSDIRFRWSVLEFR